MKSQSFLGGIFVLVAGTLVAKLLGAFYRVPLTWVLGAEGLGIYQLVFPIFSLLLVLSSTGAPTAISTMVSSRVKVGKYREADKIFRISLASLLSFSVVLGVLLCAGSAIIADLQGNSMAHFSYIAISFAVPLVSILSAFRGYYQGYQNMLPTALSQVVEQLGKLVFGLVLSYILLPNGIEYGALGAVLGVVLGEVLAVIVMFAYRIFGRKRESQLSYPNVQVPSTISSTAMITSTKNQTNNSGSNKTEFVPQEISSIAPTQPTGTGTSTSIYIDDPSTVAGYKSLMKEFGRTATPIVLASMLLPILQVVDSMLVVNLLGWGGYSTADATIMWGINSGIVNSIVNMPVVLALAVATAVVPQLSTVDTTINDDKRQKIIRAHTFTINIALPCTMAIIILAPSVIPFLYNDSLQGGAFDQMALAINLLTLSSAMILMMSLVQVQNASMQGVARARAPLLHIVIAGIVKTIIMVILVQITSINIYGVLTANLLFYIICFTLNYIYMRNKLGVMHCFSEALPTLISTLVMSVILIMSSFAFVNWNIYLALPLQLIIGGSVYIYTLILLGGADEVLSMFKKFWHKVYKRKVL